jgi:hypothetical protein
MNLSHVFIKNKKNKFSNINFIYYYKKNLNEFNLQKYEKTFFKKDRQFYLKNILMFT